MAHLSFKIGNPSRLGECMIYLRIIMHGKELKLPSGIRVRKSQWSSTKMVISHPNQNSINTFLLKFKNEIEYKLLNSNGMVTKDYLLGSEKEEEHLTLLDFINDFLIIKKGKLSEARIKSYKTLVRILKDYSNNVLLKDINVRWVGEFESYLFTRRVTKNNPNTLCNNTVNHKMKALLAILNEADKQGLYDIKNIKGYKIPRLTEYIPEHLSENEILKFWEVVDSIEKYTPKTCGYYFLLSCFAGYRISDLYTFNYETMVIGDLIKLRAKKNNKLVTIPIYPQLRKVLEYVRHNPLDVTQQKMRMWVKKISAKAGIKRDIKVHTARHSFAMMLIDKGLTIDDVAELLGDTPEVARRYARITNKLLHAKIKNIFE